MDVRQQARNGEAVGEGNAQKEEVAQAQEEKEVISIDEKIQKAYEIENEDERKNALDAIFNSDEYKKYVEDAESELKNNTTKVKEGKGSWRKSFNETNDALIKKDILRTVAEKSSSVSELNDISEAAKGLPEMLKNEVDNAVDYRMKSLSAQEEKEVVSPTEQVEQPAEFEEVKQAKEKFYKHTQDKGYVEVKRAKPVYIFGTEKAFYVKEGKEFVVSDAITGAEIGRGSTLNNAVASAEENAGSVQNLESARERFTDAYGKSPYAKLQEEFSFTQSIINNAMDAADIIENDALKDVESTAKALDDIQKKENPSDKTINLFQEIKDSYYYKGSKVLHHGSSVERLETDRDGLIWFTDEKRVADDYRKRSIVSNEANLDGYEEDAIESKSAIEVIADEQGINLSKGNIFTGQQRLDNLIDLTDVKDDGNVSNLPDFWDKLNKKGLVEKWDDIDQDYKDELIEEYQDKAVWRLLETEGIYNDIKRNGYDGVIISDVGIDGKIHKAYGLFSLKDFRESSANGISEAYHKAKADGSNPELVKAVEDLLGGNNADAYLDAMENNGIIKRDCE